MKIDNEKAEKILRFLAKNNGFTDIMFEEVYLGWQLCFVNDALTAYHALTAYPNRWVVMHKNKCNEKYKHIKVFSNSHAYSEALSKMLDAASYADVICKNLAMFYFCSAASTGRITRTVLKSGTMLEHILVKMDLENDI